MPRPRRLLPRDQAQAWPGENSGVADLDVARGLAANLREAMDGRSEREVGQLTGVSYSVVNAILKGTTWPDARTIALLEAGLDAELWPAGVARTAKQRTVER